MTRYTTSEQAVREDRAQEVDIINGKPVTRGELSDAFDLVVPRDNWKRPIDRVIEADFDTIDRVRRATVFFAGCVATVEVIEPAADRTDGKAKYRVTAPGYYAAVGA